MHQKIKKDLPADKISIIRIPVGNKQKSRSSFSMDGDDECWYNGRLYDIITVRKTKTSTIYYCLFDEKETALMKWFTKLVHFKFSNDQERNPTLSFILYMITLFCNPVFLALFAAAASAWIYNKLKLAKYLRFILPVTPPPEGAFGF
jgi:hypothetical protein